MLNKERIENNPYRILGVYVGSPISVEVNHLNRICAFSKVGQTVYFQLRGDEVLRPIARTEDSAEAAIQTLSLAKDRVENSLLWFSDADKEWGYVLNEAVQGLIEGDYTKAINSYETLISDDTLMEEFLESATHGLLTVSRENLASIISELISSCEDDMEGYWMSKEKKPVGRIAFILFEKTIMEKIENLIQSIEYYLAKVDFYELIDRFENTLNEIKPRLEKVGEMYGFDSIHYKNIVEELCKKIYARGTYLIKAIGNFVWIEKAKPRLGYNSCRKYKSEMPVGSIRACMDLIRRVDSIVNETVISLRLDNVSKRVLYSDIDTYQMTKQIELVNRDGIILRSVCSFYIKRGITITAWLLFLYWIFFTYK